MRNELVGGEAVACKYVDKPFDSSPARGPEQARRPPDATGCSPDAASQWSCHSIGTARVGGRDDNCGYWRHRPRADSHQLPCAVRVRPATDETDSAACHQAGERSPVQRNGQLSRLFFWITLLLYNTDAQLEGEAASRRVCMGTSDSY